MMKNILKAASVLTLILLFGVDANANLITSNPDFETGDFTGWNTGGASVQADNGPSLAGFSCADLYSSGAGDSKDLRSNGYSGITVGDEYQLTFDYKTFPGSTGNPQIRLRFFDNGGGFKGEAQKTLALTNDQWVTESVTAICPAGSDYFDVILTVSLFGTSQGTTRFDNADVQLVPEPATIALLGLGSLLLRKRK